MPEDKPTNTHDLSAGLRKLAALLESKPPTEMPSSCTLNIGSFYGARDKFVAMAKVFGGTKQTNEFHYILRSVYGPLMVDVYTDRKTICKLITPAVPAVYDCPELLTPKEQDEIEGGQ